MQQNCKHIPLCNEKVGCEKVVQGWWMCHAIIPMVLLLYSYPPPSYASHILPSKQLIDRHNNICILHRNSMMSHNVISLETCVQIECKSVMSQARLQLASKELLKGEKTAMLQENSSLVHFSRSLKQHKLGRRAAHWSNSC